MGRRFPPRKVAEEWIKKDENPPGFAIRNFEMKGRGIVTTIPREKGDFLLVYKGEIIDAEEGERREESNSTGYRFFFFSKGKEFCVDASAESGHFGRLVNHGRKEKNAAMKEVMGSLCLFCVRDIHAEEEILYDYGLKNLPWDKPKPSREDLPNEDKLGTRHNWNEQIDDVESACTNPGLQTLKAIDMIPTESVSNERHDLQQETTSDIDEIPSQGQNEAKLGTGDNLNEQNNNVESSCTNQGLRTLEAMDEIPSESVSNERHNRQQETTSAIDEVPSQGKKSVYHVQPRLLPETTTATDKVPSGGMKDVCHVQPKLLPKTTNAIDEIPSQGWNNDRLGTGDNLNEQIIDVESSGTKTGLQTLEAIDKIPSETVLNARHDLQEETASAIDEVPSGGQNEGKLGTDKNLNEQINDVGTSSTKTGLQTLEAIDKIPSEYVLNARHDLQEETASAMDEVPSRGQNEGKLGTGDNLNEQIIDVGSSGPKTGLQTLKAIDKIPLESVLNARHDLQEETASAIDEVPSGGQKEGKLGTDKNLNEQINYVESSGTKTGLQTLETMDEIPSESVPNVRHDLQPETASAMDEVSSGGMKCMRHVHPRLLPETTDAMDDVPSRGQNKDSVGTGDNLNEQINDVESSGTKTGLQTLKTMDEIPSESEPNVRHDLQTETLSAMDEVPSGGMKDVCHVQPRLVPETTDAMDKVPSGGMKDVCHVQPSLPETTDAMDEVPSQGWNNDRLGTGDNLNEQINYVGSSGPKTGLQTLEAIDKIPLESVLNARHDPHEGTASAIDEVPSGGQKEGKLGTDKNLNEQLNDVGTSSTKTGLQTFETMDEIPSESVPNVRHDLLTETASAMDEVSSGGMKCVCHVHPRLLPKTTDAMDEVPSRGQNKDNLGTGDNLNEWIKYVGCPLEKHSGGIFVPSKSNSWV